MCCGLPQGPGPSVQYTVNVGLSGFRGGASCKRVKLFNNHMETDLKVTVSTGKNYIKI